MRKIISVLTVLAIVLALVGFSGCSSTKTDDKLPENTKSEETAKSDKTVLTCTYNVVNPEDIPPEKEINEYLDSLGCDFEMSFIPIEYTGHNLENLVSQGTPPDIVYTVVLEFEDQDITIYNKLYYDDMYLCLDDYLFNTDAGKKLYEAFPEKHWNELKINGSIYAIDGSFATVTPNFGYIYDKALVEKYGYDITLSPLQQLDTLKEIADSENMIPFRINDNFFLVIGYTSARRLAAGAVFDDDSCRAISVLEDEEFLSNIEIAYTLAQNGLADIFDGHTNYFALPLILSVNMQNGVPITYLQKIMLPQMRNSPKMQSSTNAIGIYKNSQNPDKAFEFLSLCMTDKYLNNLLTYGVEGGSCKLDSDGYVTKRWDGMSITIHQFINRYIAYPNTLEIPTASREQYIETMEAAEERPAAAGFAVNVDPVYDRCVAVDKLLQKMTLEIVKPKADVSFSDFVAKYKNLLDDAGLQEILEEVNRQYEVFKALGD